MQLVPLIYGNALLERIKDNYIIVEVYYKNTVGMNNLLGIAKLPVHQLYIAYRDPIVLPHLLSSKVRVVMYHIYVKLSNFQDDILRKTLKFYNYLFSIL